MPLPILGRALARRALLGGGASRADRARVAGLARAYAGSIRVETRTRGGHKLRAFLRRARSGEFRAAYLRYAEQGLNREFVPELRIRTPRRTGRLQKSLRIERSGRGFELRSIFYGPMVEVQPGQSFQELSHLVVRERVPSIARRAYRRALRDIS